MKRCRIMPVTAIPAVFERNNVTPEELADMFRVDRSEIAEWLAMTGQTSHKQQPRLNAGIPAYAAGISRAESFRRAL
jgi:hemoglobin-like flavoprotein